MAVYTVVNDTALNTFLSAYNLGKVLSFGGIAEGVENSNYLLHTTKDKFILTLYEKRVDVKDLPFFITLMEHLSKVGISSPLPVAAQDGTVLQELMGRPCALFSFLDGTFSSFPNSKKCKALGAILAELHVKADGIAVQRTNALGPDSWRPIFDSIGKGANILGSGMYAAIAKRLDQILTSWPSNLPQGIIHADLFPNNVLFTDDKVTGLIDFYFACNDIFAYDIGICLNSWCFDADGSFNITKSWALIQGYQSVRPMSDEEKKAIPVLAAGSAMRFFLTRLYDWIHTPENALVSLKDPMEYWAVLRFHQSVSGSSAYGLDMV